MTLASHSRQPLAPQEVLALCQELRDVIAAGVPLHLGLTSVGAISPRLQHVLEQLAERSRRGEDLIAALDAESDSIPPILRGVVLAGLRSGHIDEMLDDLTQTSEALRSLRQLLFRGLLYPAVVVLLAAIFSSTIFPVYFDWLRTAFDNTTPTGWAGLALRNEWLISYGGWCLLGMGTVAWLFSWLIGLQQGDQLSGWGIFSQIPALRTVLRECSLARVVHLLSLLVKYRVPLPEALRIVAASAEDRRLSKELYSLADQAAAGNAFTYPARSRFPKFLQWMLLLGQRNSQLTDTLREAAEFYRQRAISRAEWIAKLVPGIAIIVFGGGFTLLYAVFVYGPVTDLLKHLGTG